MFSLHRFSIRNVLIGSLFAMAFLSMVMDLGLYYYRESQELRTAAIADTETIINVLKEDFVKAIVVNTPDIAAETNGHLASFDNILDVYLFDADKHIAYFYSREHEAKATIPHGVEHADIIHNGFLHVFRPLRFENHEYGGVYARVSIAGMDARVRTLQRALLTSLPVLSVISFLVALIMQRAFTAPISRLADVLKKVTETNDYSVRINAQEQNEFKILNSGFNRMLEKIEQDSRALQSAKARFQNTLEAIVEGVVVCDKWAVVEYVNPAAELLLNLKELDMLGQPIAKVFDVLDEATATVVENPLVTCLRDGHAIRLVRLKIHTREQNNSKTVEASAAPLFESSGGVVGAVLALHDVTESRLAEDAARTAINEKIAAEASNSAKTAFLAHVSHELRTPISAMLGFAELVLDDKQTSVESRGLIEQVMRNGEHLTQIINDLLDLSKIEADSLEINTTAVAPQDLIEEIQSLVDVKAKAKGLALHVRIESEVPSLITTDLLRAKQVLLNLCSNAIKFTEQGSITIHVNSDIERQQLVIDVEDTGIGLADAQKATLFSPFGHVVASPARRYSGSGLGLSLSKKLAQLLGGDLLLVESQIEVGSTFRFTMPTGLLAERYFAEVGSSMTPDEIESDSELSDADSAQGLELPAIQGHVLLAEDTEVLQRMMVLVLTKAGVQVTVVRDGHEAVQAVRYEKFDLVLMDLQMPVMDGLEATRRLRKNGFTAPIIALTAKVTGEDRELSLAAGCDEFVAKPIGRQRLLTLLHRYLNAKPESAREAH